MKGTNTNLHLPRPKVLPDRPGRVTPKVVDGDGARSVDGTLTPDPTPATSTLSLLVEGCVFLFTHFCTSGSTGASPPPTAPTASPRLGDSVPLVVSPPPRPPPVTGPTVSVVSPRLWEGPFESWGLRSTQGSSTCLESRPRSSAPRPPDSLVDVPARGGSVCGVL